jgi:outer membrane protein OmpA-like peptidoglycan-associated protein
MFILRMAASAALVLMAGATALAADGTLQVIIGGEAYDGPPRFEVSFGGAVLGEAAVDAAIDTGSVGRFADAPDKARYVQTLSFKIPDGAFKPGAEVRLRLINEAYGGDGSNRDRNLYLASVAVNGRAVTLSGLATQGTSSSVDNETLGEFLVLRDGNVEAVSRAPEGGWPTVDATAVAAVPASSATPEATPAPQPVAVKLPEPAAEPAADATAAPVPEPAAAPDPVTVASVETATPAASETVAGSCGLDQLYNVVGFNESSNDLTLRLMERLDQIVADIGTEKCKVLVTGYSSKQGDHATNALFAIERAQNVLSYLRQAGLSFEKVTATGGGATDQFGADFSTNRRVVISVAP